MMFAHSNKTIQAVRPHCDAHITGIRSAYVERLTVTLTTTFNNHTATPCPSPANPTPSSTTGRALYLFILPYIYFKM